MYFSKFQLLNYKSFLDSGEICLKQGFNVITGKNSAGKTALLEGLTLSFEGRPHRSEETVKYDGAPHSPTSIARFTLNIERDELFRLIAMGTPVSFPLPVRNFAWPTGRYDGSPGAAQEFLSWLQTQPEFRISASVNRAGGGQSWLAEGNSFGLYDAQPTDENGRRQFMNVGIEAGERLVYKGGGHSDPSNDASLVVAQRALNQIYRFTAERFSMGESPFGYNTVLAPNAQNLPEVLNILTSNPQRFEQFNELVRTILPQVQRVSVRPVTAVPSQVQVKIWPHDPKTMREDLAIPLTQCGSGVGQVLAILYVVMTSVQPQVIIIDEPQNFLHPGAVRKLVEVLRNYPQHQYIMATHSPTVIAAAGPEVLIMALLDKCKSSLLTLDVSQSEDLHYSLSDVGASLSDVFGADKILWVEGATEQECFPLIIRTILGFGLMGIAVIAIKDTGDLEGRDAKRVFQLYNRLSHASALLPPAVGFVLDDENRSNEKKEELNKIGQGKVKFIPRRMYENYLLHSAGIAEVASGIAGFRDGHPILAEEVQALIEAKRQDLTFYSRGAKAVPTDWERRIDAARLLAEIFTELSESRVSYEKTKHSVALTKWLLANDAALLAEVADLLNGILTTKAVRVS